MSRRGKIVGAVIGLVALAGALIWIAMDRAPTAREIKLADGRIIQIAGVSYGASHSLKEGFRARLSRFIPPPVKPLFGPAFGSSFGFARPGMAVWLMCFDPATQTYQKGWINTCTAVDEHGCEFPAQGIGSTGDGYYFAQVVSFGAYPRNADSFICRVYDMNAKPIADLRVPITPQAAGATWSPEPLPAFKTNGALVMRFDAFTNRSAVFTILRDGREESFWKAGNIAFEDSSGNAGDFLCNEERAWQWSAKLHRTEQAPFASYEIVTLAGITIPPAGKLVTLPLNTTIAGKAITNLSVAGPGRYEWSNGVLVASVPFPGGGGHGSSTSSRYTNVWRRSAHPSLILPTLSLPKHAKLIVRARDADDAKGEIRAGTLGGSTHGESYYDLPEDLTGGPYDIDFIVDPGYRFEVKVAPPSRAPSVTPARRRTAASKAP